MREIKFRAWNPNSNAMMLPQGAYNAPENFFATSKSINGTLIPMQYTGLKDKNGKEIYEGDIVGGIMAAGAGYQRRPGKPCVYEVIVHLGGWGYQFQLRQITKLTGDYRAYPNFSEVEVIGNIYENPELLK